MSYEKLGFVNGQTLGAEHLNHMEDGIANAVVDDGYAKPVWGRSVSSIPEHVTHEFSGEEVFEISREDWEYIENNATNLTVEYYEFSGDSSGYYPVETTYHYDDMMGGVVPDFSTAEGWRMSYDIIQLGETHKIPAEFVEFVPQIIWVSFTQAEEAGHLYTCNKTPRQIEAAINAGDLIVIREYDYYGTLTSVTVDMVYSAEDSYTGYTLTVGKFKGHPREGIDTTVWYDSKNAPDDYFDTVMANL